MAGSDLIYSRELGLLLFTGYWCLLKDITTFKIEKTFAKVKRNLNRKKKQKKTIFSKAVTFLNCIL